MISLSIAAVLLSALCAGLILQRAAGAARRTDADPTPALYRRQLDEIDDLAERGLLGGQELRAAKAEASRRLLGAAEQAKSSPVTSPSRGVRLAVLAGAVIAPLAAVGLYVWRGSPEIPDRPFSERLRAWSQSDPNQLTAAQMAAVLVPYVKKHPADAEPLAYLARAQALSGNLPAAADTLRRAVRLAPKAPELWVNLGVMLLMQGQGEETAPAQGAFKQAVALDPKNPTARYHLARARIAAGDLRGGLADWRALIADLPAGDPARLQLEREADAVQAAGHLIAAPAQQAAAPAPAPGAAAAAPSGDQQAFIQSMVARLEARLKAEPNDPAGWARLIRSYAVLGDQAKMEGALAQARKLFKSDPAALKQLEGAMSAPQGVQ